LERELANNNVVSPSRYPQIKVGNLDRGVTRSRLNDGEDDEEEEEVKGLPSIGFKPVMKYRPSHYRNQT